MRCVGCVRDDYGVEFREQRGASLVEYALLLALISVVVFSAVAFFGSSTGGGFGKSKNCISAAYNGTLGAASPTTP